jgi:DNA transposition AAA+ family ATPase
VNTTGKMQDLMLSITMADGSVRLIQDDEAEALPESALAALDQVLASFTVGE